MVDVLKVADKQFNAGDIYDNHHQRSYDSIIPISGPVGEKVEVAKVEVQGEGLAAFLSNPEFFRLFVEQLKQFAYRNSFEEVILPGITFKGEDTAIFKLGRVNPKWKMRGV